MSIKSINGEPIVVGTSGIDNNAVTKDKALSGTFMAFGGLIKPDNLQNISDCNLLTPNTIYYFGSDITENHVANLPVYGETVRVETTCANVSEGNLRPAYQIAVTYHGNLFIRAANGYIGPSSQSSDFGYSKWFEMCKRDEFEQITNIELLPTNWNIGVFNRTTGNYVASNKDIVCLPFQCEAGTIVEVDEGWYIGGVEYDTSGTFTPEHVQRIRGVSLSTSCKTFVVENDCYLKLGIHRKDNSIINDAASESLRAVKNYGVPDWEHLDMVIERSENIVKFGTYHIEYASISASTSSVNAYATARTLMLPIVGGKTYTICKRDKTRFRVGTSESYPSIGTELSNVMVDDDHLTMTIAANTNDHWLAVYYYESSSTDETPEEALRHLTVVESGTACLPVTGETAVDGVARARIGQNIDHELLSPSYYLSDPAYEEQLFNEQFGFSHSTSTNVSGIQSQDIYDLWDGLVASYPYNVDEGIVIGHAIDENGDSVGNIKAYRVHPREYVGQNLTIQVPYDPATPTYFFTSGVHGREKSAQWGLYQLFARMLGGSNAYSGLLSDAVYWVVPCVCRWGCDHTSRYLAYSLVTSEGPETDPNRLCTTPLNIPDYAPEISSLISFLDSHGIGDNPNNVFIDFHNCDNIYTYLGVNGTQIEDRYIYDSVMVELANAWWHKSQDTTGGRSSYYGDASCANAYITREISPENPVGSIARYIGETYGIRTSVIHETVASGVMLNGSSQAAGGRYFFTGEALAKLMDSQRAFVTAIHEDNKLRLRSQVRRSSDGGIELFGKIKINLQDGGVVTWESL